jgi:hypothetical protein
MNANERPNLLQWILNKDFHNSPYYKRDDRLNGIDDLVLLYQFVVKAKWK